ncbi:hypothetical protein [Halomonas sp. BM-2019]|uniref:hypothetical protein n=1 Tax=Halomonas sp. BM-2019 TaxID=2811227 RepID=UPI001B3C352A|nr:MAG: hypothetical protein J5F18_14520 [Halomonas sp. BM-2019]
MTNAKAAFPTIWDQVDARPVFMPLMRGLWRGIMKMAEALCESRARRGFLPHV